MRPKRACGNAGSGPAAGALVAAYFGRELATDDDTGDLLALDMGGTTAKLAMVEDGAPRTAYAFEAARQKRFAEEVATDPHIHRRVD